MMGLYAVQAVQSGRTATFDISMTKGSAAKYSAPCLLVYVFMVFAYSLIGGSFAWLVALGACWMPIACFWATVRRKQRLHIGSDFIRGFYNTGLLVRRRRNWEIPTTAVHRVLFANSPTSVAGLLVLEHGDTRSWVVSLPILPDERKSIATDCANSLDVPCEEVTLEELKQVGPPLS